jgi:hypothetical protein
MEFIELVRNANREGLFRFVVYYNNKKEIKRLFIGGSRGEVCEFKKGSSRMGYILDISNVINIELIKPKNKIDIFRKNVDKIIKYLSASGLWQEKLKDCKYLTTLSDEEIIALKNNFYDESKKHNITLWGLDCFYSFFDERGIKAVNFEDKIHKEYVVNNIKQAIRDKVDYRTKWRKNYDNSIHIEHGNNNLRGWYSEEYKDCGNGHYYYLLDETHALYGEKD